VMLTSELPTSDGAARPRPSRRGPPNPRPAFPKRGGARPGPGRSRGYEDVACPPGGASARSNDSQLEGVRDHAAWCRGRGRGIMQHGAGAAGVGLYSGIVWLRRVQFAYAAAVYGFESSARVVEAAE
jgi:hypothetical protein